ncbi:MAG TPA: sensor histidine kinase [Rectinemataceae bacterium]|nr:sensor histidine kinase [Rectinemataceae bacterium]
MKRSGSLRGKIIAATGLMLAVIGIATLYTNFATAELARTIGLLFKGNLMIEDVRNGLTATSTGLSGYLTSRSSDYLRSFIQDSTRLQKSANLLNREIRQDEALLLQRELAGLVNGYLEAANAAVSAKRGRDVAVYTASYGDAERTAELAVYLVERIESRNLAASLQAWSGLDARVRSVIFTNAALVVAAVLTAFLLFVRYSYSIMGPLLVLADAAKRVAHGDYDKALPHLEAAEEIAVTADAFENMRLSVRSAFDELKSKAEVEGKLIREELRLVDLDRRLKDAELLALQSQINPHFLFNTLSAGLQLALSESADRTADFIEKLSGFIRYSLRPVSRLVSVADEIESVERYVWLLRLRFGPRYDFSIEVEEAARRIGTPALVLQPLVENAVGHGLRDRTEGGRVRVVARLEELEGRTVAVLEVCDNGRGMPEEEIERVLRQGGEAEVAEGGETASSGIGLHNVIRRVLLVTKGEGRVDIQSDGGSGTQVRILLPAREREV